MRMDGASAAQMQGTRQTLLGEGVTGACSGEYYLLGCEDRLVAMVLCGKICNDESKQTDLLRTKIVSILLVRSRSTHRGGQSAAANTPSSTFSGFQVVI